MPLLSWEPQKESLLDCKLFCAVRRQTSNRGSAWQGQTTCEILIRQQDEMPELQVRL